jgi:hypothetical protein
VSPYPHSANLGAELFKSGAYAEALEQVGDAKTLGTNGPRTPTTRAIKWPKARTRPDETRGAIGSVRAGELVESSGVEGHEAARQEALEHARRELIGGQ